MVKPMINRKRKQLHIHHLSFFTLICCVLNLQVQGQETAYFLAKPNRWNKADEPVTIVVPITGKKEVAEAKLFVKLYDDWQQAKNSRGGIAKWRLNAPEYFHEFIEFHRVSGVVARGEDGKNRDYSKSDSPVFDWHFIPGKTVFSKWHIFSKPLPNFVVNSSVLQMEDFLANHGEFETIDFECEFVIYQQLGNHLETRIERLAEGVSVSWDYLGEEFNYTLEFYSHQESGNSRIKWSKYTEFKLPIEGNHVTLPPPPSTQNKLQIFRVVASLDYQEVSKGAASEIAVKTTRIIRSNAEWEMLWNKHIGDIQSELPKIDFDNEMVVFVCSGRGGKVVRITGMTHNRNRLFEVGVQLTNQEGMSADESPFHIVKTPRLDLPHIITEFE